MTFGEETGGASATDSTLTSQVEPHHSTDSFRTKFNQQTQSATTAIVSAVAAATETDPLELPPLWAVLDPDALNELFDSVTYERDRDEISITFEYAEHIVTVSGHGTVIVESADDAQS